MEIFLFCYFFLHLVFDFHFREEFHFLLISVVLEAQFLFSSVDCNVLISVFNLMPKLSQN